MAIFSVQIVAVLLPMAKATVNCEVHLSLEKKSNIKCLCMMNTEASGQTEASNISSF